MATKDSEINRNFKMVNEGKNLINENQNDNFDSSNNYENSNYQKKQVFKKMNDKEITSSKRKLNSNTKEKTEKSSKGLKSETSNFPNNINTNNIQKNKKENILTSSFAFYKESEFVSLFKKLYSGAKQKYISIMLLIYSLILFFLSIYDLMKKIQKNKNGFLLNNLIIFIFEMICSGLIICFHIFFYFINIGNNYVIFLIMSIIILIFSLIYIGIYIQKKSRLLEIILYVAYNLFLVIINLIYLFLSYHLVKQNNKMQQNIEDIMNFSIRNEKIPDFSKKERNKEHKKKPVSLVEEDK